MQIILNWLSGHQNFIVGKMLYNKFGSNEALKTLLSKGETPFTKAQLVTELQKLTVTPRPVPVVVHKETGEMPETDNAVLLAIRNEWLTSYQRMNLLRHQLDKYDGDNSKEAIDYRKPLASEIKSLDKEINAVWEKRDYYEKHGKLPFVPETKFVIPTDPVKIGALINNIKRYITRYRKQMRENPEEPKYAQLYLEYKAQYKQIMGKEYEEKQ